jgi:ABC-type transport system substrate-binding protein
MRMMLDRLATPGAVARLAAIVYLKQLRTGEAVADIRADRADHVTEPAPALAQQAMVARRFGQPSAGQPRRSYVTPLLATGELAFDTRHGPFADPRLRRAVSYALDRLSARGRDPVGPGLRRATVTPCG